MTDTPQESRAQFRDLEFGSVVATKSSMRLLNRDGSFNPARKGLGLKSSLCLYNELLTMSWPAFALLTAAGYSAANVLFALAYIARGPGAIQGPPSPTRPTHSGNRFSLASTRCRRWAMGTWSRSRFRPTT